uniref:Activin_recp domain-containing protein n=1 Tax=Caenorhabditis tropicalis TaxID=1561998 RepID=A0A1I7TZ81_9PELO
MCTLHLNQSNHSSNSTDYCNELQNVKDVKDISYLTCNSIENSLWPVTEPCVHPWCVKKASIYSDETSYCNSQQMEIEMFSIGISILKKCFCNIESEEWFRGPGNHHVSSFRNKEISSAHLAPPTKKFV